MPVDERTVAQLALELARTLGDLVVAGTATGGTGSTLVDTNGLVFANDDDLNGSWVGIYEGTAIGDERVVTDFATSTDTITVTQAFSATPDTTSKYFVTRRWRPQQYLDAIAAAVRHAQTFQLLPLDDISGHLHELITFGDILSTDGNANGQMEQFTSGVPNGWTADGNTTSAAEDGSSNVQDLRRGSFSYRMTSDGTNLANLTTGIKYSAKYIGTKVTLKGWVRNGTEGRALVRLDDGVSADTKASADQDVWETISLSYTLSSVAQKLDVDLEVSAGSQAAAIWGDVRLIWDEGRIYEYDLPTRLAYLAGVQREIRSSDGSTLSENAWVDLPRDVWYVQRGSSPKLVFRPEKYLPPTDVHIRLIGQAYPATITVDTPATAYAETVDANAGFVIAYCRWYLLRSLPYDVMNETIRRLASDAEREMRVQEELHQTQPFPGSEPVRVN